MKRNALLSSTNISWGMIALIAAIFFLLLRLIAPSFFWYALTPVFRAGEGLTQVGHILLGSFENSTALTAQNEKLARENSALATQNEALAEKIQSISGLGVEAKGVIAGVVARPPESPYDTLVLSAGSAEGVMLGQEVFGEGNVPLGTVSSVFAHFSRVTLFSAPGVSVLGWVGPKHLPLIIKGSGAGVLSASVPRSADINAGDVVSVPGPGSLPIGTIARVDSDPSSPSVTLRIAPAINLFSVTWVTVRDIGKTLEGFSSSTPVLP